MPMASTSASSETVLAEKPSASSTAKVPISDTGTAMIGMSVARQLPRNRNTTITTSTKASISVWTTSSMVSVTNVGGVVGDLVGDALGEAAPARRSSAASTRAATLATALAPGAW